MIWNTKYKKEKENKKQRNVVDRMKRRHSKLKKKKNQKRERLLFALKLFGGIIITALEISLIFA
jgi:hypothetical protein